MNLSEIQLLYDYNDWANRRILAFSAKLTPEQLTAPTTHSWGNLHSTLVHTLDTEYGWRASPGELDFTYYMNIRAGIETG